MSKRVSVLQKTNPSSSAASHSGNESAAPPAYSQFGNTRFPQTGSDVQQPTDPGQPTADEINQVNLIAAFENLTIPDGPSDPTVGTCLVHLKLLFAIQSMKEDVGYTDGLWGLWDSMAGPPEQLKASEKKSPKEKMQDKTLAALSKIREKRWALFVARAVERYEAWWVAMSRPAYPLSEKLMTGHASYFLNFPRHAEGAVKWSADLFPPLDVLMVWHTHMLNPRDFLEDSMLAGLRAFWAAGMPWHTVNEVIDSEFNYNVSDDCKAQWVAQTGLAWENTDDPLIKSLSCPRCTTLLEIPWTTCGQPEEYQPRPGELPYLVGNGYGDGHLRYPCPKCGITIRKELLSVAKFVKDVRALLGSGNRPMPGTVLDPSTGQPSAIPTKYPESTRFPRTFPNRLLKSGAAQMRTTMLGLITSSSGSIGPTMETVRDKIETVLKSNMYRKEVDGLKLRTGLANYRLHPTSRIAVRKMMSRYWENFSPFALDLSGAVLRQGLFVDKMVRIDWLHSPAAADTMRRLLAKYSRFFTILAANPGKVAVPTLDVDLAWHTHQLSPPRYYAYSLVTTKGKLVDHDDKMDEGVLSASFEWTSKEYQDRFGEVYSECTCWYCEAVRAAHVSSIGSVLGLSRHEKVAEGFYTSGHAQFCPPPSADVAAHVSAHNAVKTNYTLPLGGGAPTRYGNRDETVRQDARRAETRRKVAAHMAALHRKRVEEGYARARKRAEKRGRKVPERDDGENGSYYDHWGYPYYHGGPYMYAMWYTPGLYYGWHPGYVAGCGGGSWGSCAAGSCGGGVAAGACGGAGGCGGGDAGGCGGGGGSCGGIGGDGGGGGGGGGDGGGGGGGGCGGGS